MAGKKKTLELVDESVVEKKEEETILEEGTNKEIKVKARISNSAELLAAAIELEKVTTEKNRLAAIEQKLKEKFRKAMGLSCHELHVKNYVIKQTFGVQRTLDASKVRAIVSADVYGKCERVTPFTKIKPVRVHD